MYDSNDETLVLERKKAKGLCFIYNNTNPTDTTERKKIIQELFGKIGENFNIESDFGAITVITLRQEKIFT